MRHIYAAGERLVRSRCVPVCGPLFGRMTLSRILSIHAHRCALALGIVLPAACWHAPMRAVRRSRTPILATQSGQGSRRITSTVEIRRTLRAPAAAAVRDGATFGALLRQHRSAADLTQRE